MCCSGGTRRDARRARGRREHRPSGGGPLPAGVHGAARPVPAAPGLSRPGRRPGSRARRSGPAAGPPFGLDTPWNGHRSLQVRGLTVVLDWLQDQPGRPGSSGGWPAAPRTAGPAGAGPGCRWLAAEHGGHRAAAGTDALTTGCWSLICADVIRPALQLAAAQRTGRKPHGRDMARARDPAGFARLRRLCAAAAGIADAQRPDGRPPGRACIVAAKGGMVADVTVGDCWSCSTPSAAIRQVTGAGDELTSTGCCAMLGIFRADAPPSLRVFRARGQLQPRPADRPLAAWPAGRSATCWWTTCGNASQRGLHQPGRAGRHPGRLVLGRPEAHHPGHRHAAPAAPRSPTRGSSGCVTKTMTVTAAGRQRGRDRPARGSAPRLPGRGPGLLPRPGPVGGGRPGPVGAVGRALPGPRRRDCAARRTHAAASPGWTPGPASGCPSFPPWPAASGTPAPRHRRPPGGRRPQPAPGRHSPPPGRPCAGPS